MTCPPSGEGSLSPYYQEQAREQARAAYRVVQAEIAHLTIESQRLAAAIAKPDMMSGEAKELAAQKKAVDEKMAELEKIPEPRFGWTPQDDDQKPLPPSRGQQPDWLSGTQWNIPPQRRNNALYDTQPSFVPMPPPNDIEARFQDVLRHADELTLALDLLRGAVRSKDRVIGPGDNQGPPLSIEELDDDVDPLIALLKEEGSKIKTADDAKPIVEQAEKTVQRAQQIKAWLIALASGAVALGAKEVAKDLTHPLWETVANKILELYRAIAVWVALLI
jgi:hypothetical protein